MTRAFQRLLPAGVMTRLLAGDPVLPAMLFAARLVAVCAMAV